MAIVEVDNLGEGCRVWSGAHICKGAIVGNDCNIGEHVFIDGKAIIGSGVTIKNNVHVCEGVTIEDHVFVGPYMAFTNDNSPRARNDFTAEDVEPTIIEEGASLGAKCTILPGLRIGHDAFVGAAAMVTRDVFPHEIVIGNPARHHGFACHCGKTIEVDEVGNGKCSCDLEVRNLKRGK